MLNIDTTPFSRRGSYFVISTIENALYIRDVHGGDARMGCLLKIEMLDLKKEQLPYTVMFEEHQLCLEHEHASLAFVLPSPHVLRMKGCNCMVRLSAVLAEYDHVNKLAQELFELHSYSCETKLRLEVLHGHAQSNIVWESAKKTHAVLEFSADEACDASPAGKFFDVAFERYAVVPAGSCAASASVPTAPLPSFESEKQNVQKEYTRWVENFTAPAEAEHGGSTHDAAYLLWASLVEPAGILPSETLYMSKNCMTNVWSWDHCFVAMALSQREPELAYQQYMVFKKFQHASGALPDYMNDVFASYGCVKPPIHGWAYLHMMRKCDYFLDEVRLLEVYDMLVKMNNYWLRYRMGEKPLPYYNHGNDSGWDNATVFEQGCPVIAPDLTSYLVLNCDALASIALRLNKEAEARVWNEKAQSLLKTLLAYLHDGQQFYTRLYEDEKRVESKSLINLMPILMGELLPSAVLEPLVGDLRSAEYLSDCGFATEALSSDLYAARGYWRGPVWPMTTMLIVDGLRRSGKCELAQSAARRFVRLVERSGMAENFDAQTGAALEDLAFTCTASVYLLLLDYLYS